MMAMRSSFVVLLISLCGLLPVANGQQAEPVKTVAASTDVWTSKDAMHVYGFPDVAAKKKGVLVLSATTLTFTGKSENSSIARDTITAVSAGNERIELWGTGGRLLRMAIPEGGGLAAAAVMHHRVDMLTVEFRDLRGGVHSAVFYLPAKEATLALAGFQGEAFSTATGSEAPCPGNPVEPNSVLVETPDWDETEVPAAYKSLVYEHVIDRLRKAKDVSHVFRQGEVDAGSACPQYTIHIAIEVFKPGNQVMRAATGPIGMFASATKMTFNVRFTDASGGFEKSEQIKVAVRTESESTTVADKVAKSLAKHYSASLKNANVGDPQSLEETPANGRAPVSAFAH